MHYSEWFDASFDFAQDLLTIAELYVMRGSPEFNRIHEVPC